MNEFTNWFENKSEDCGLCSPPMNSQLAVDFLQKYLLGDGWYCTGIAQTNAQCNTEIVFNILNKHSRRFRKEWKRYCKIKRIRGAK